VKVIESASGKTAELNRLPVPPGDVDMTWADISKAKSVLGYNPCTQFDEGIKKFIAWYEKNHLLGHPV